MRWLLASIAALILAPGASVAEEPPATRYSAQAFFDTTDFTMARSERAFAPDGSRLLVSSNETGVFNVYLVDTKSGVRTAMTSSTTNANFAVGYFPDGKRFLYTADNGGNELDHLFVGGLNGLPDLDLTPGDALKASFVGWIEDGSAFFVATNERDARYFDLYRYDAESYARTLVHRNTEGFDGYVIARDGRHAAMVLPRTSSDNNIYLATLTGDPDAPAELITEHTGNIDHSIFSFTPDSAALIYGTDEHGEFTQAWGYRLSDKSKVPLVEADWDVMYLNYSPSGRYRLHAINEDGSTRITVYDAQRARALKMPTRLPAGDILSVRFFPGERKIAFLLVASNAPANLYTLDLRTQRFAKLTESLNPAINPRDLVTSSVVRYPSYDGLEIPSIFYRPKGASSANRAPAIVFVHGGPGGQTRTGYSAMIQHLVNHGYAVLGANNRGSSGYGKTFYHMDDKRHGDVDLKDIVAARSYLAGLDWIDPDRIAVMGGSYGGYMTMAALAFHPDVFDAGINIFGVTNWVRTLTSIPPWWEAFKEALYDEMGDPATDGERHRAISPLFHASAITKPVLVVQGANDPRVLQIESDEMVAAIKANGVPVEYLLFPDEGHGFLKRENRIAASDAYVSFLERYLRGGNAN